ncbi:interferon regulatory factor 6-like isoform X2 [Haliotis rufescens]|uniref:interferon regulatory factor 6-like isoform X2 n=1 Tax=Haliotis rufescens TaxID=6454 RepID=UPI001EB02E82|nr:interferon regulatory factor 6-like isoform X2 [Haliotis rufescens]
MLTTPPMFYHPLYPQHPQHPPPPTDLRQHLGYDYSHHRVMSSSHLNEPQNRQRLRPWLEAKINSGNFPGLEWVDRGQYIFKIPWKHGGKQDWSESDSLIFKEWAIHTGRFRDGIDQPDWPSWKTRLRCALNKLPDIQEIKDMSNLDGNSPFRVYRFLPKKGQESPHRRNGVPPRYEADDHYAHSSAIKQEMTSNIPKTVSDTISGESETGIRVSSLGSDLGGIDVQDLIPLPDRRAPSVGASHVTYTLKEEEMDTDNLVIDERPYPTDAHTGAPSAHNHGHGERGMPIADSSLHQLMMLRRLHKEPELHEVIVKLKYRHTEVAGHHVKNPIGCRLFYGPMMDTMVENLQEEMYGPAGLDQLHFPLCDNMIDNHRQSTLTTQLLNVLDRGLILESVNGDVYATRKCRLVIFVSQPQSPYDQPMKLYRNKPPVKVFDYQDYFLPTLQRALNGECPPPSAEILIGFGQDWKMEKQPYNNLLISATVFHARAYHQLSQIPPALLVSTSDEYDRYLDNFKQLGLDQRS